jgi:hypothetical protein
MICSRCAGTPQQERGHVRDGLYGCGKEGSAQHCRNLHPLELLEHILDIKTLEDYYAKTI